MFSTFLFILLLIFVSSQSSILWSSLMVIPISVLVMSMLLLPSVASGLLLFVFVLVFISGLMVFVTSLSLISYMDMGFSFLKSTILLVTLFSFPYWNSVSFNQANLVVFSFWMSESGNLILLIFVILLLALWAMSKFMLEFKGTLRLL